MSALSRTCYWSGDLERWSDCDGHWFCLCGLPDGAPPVARAFDWLRRKLLSYRFRLPVKMVVPAVLWAERRIDAVRS